VESEVKEPKGRGLAWLWSLVSLGAGLLLGFLLSDSARTQQVARQQIQLLPDTKLRYERVWRLVIGGIGVVALLAALTWLIPQIIQVLLLLAFSLLLATALRPLATGIHRWRIPLTGAHLPLEVAVLFIYIGLLMALALVGLFFVPQVVAEARSLAENLPEYAAYFTGLLDRLSTVPLLPSPEEARQTLQDQLISGLSLAGRLVVFTIGVVGGVFSLLLVAVLALFLISEADRIIGGIVSLLPLGSREKGKDVIAKCGRKVQAWVVGALVLSAAVGIMTVVSLLVIGMPFPFLLGFIMAVTEFIPMVGPYIGGIPALLVAATQSWQTVILVTIIYVAIQQIENNFLAPVIVSNQVGLSPLTVIVALLLGSALLGIIGALLAVPAAAVIQVFWTEVVDPWIRGVERYWESERTDV